MLATVSRCFRARRMRTFLEHFRIDERTRILDVGGVPGFWDQLPRHPAVVVLNADRLQIPGAHRAVVGDGRFLPFRDESFDIVVSNSVIEHVGDRESQKQFAKEVTRVGRSYWVQTPNFWFPVEQHLLLPVMHWLPRPWQRVVINRFTVLSLIAAKKTHRDYYIRHYLEEICLLSASELRAFFPEASILEERVLGISKSLIAIGRSAPE